MLYYYLVKFVIFICAINGRVSPPCWHIYKFKSSFLLFWIINFNLVIFIITSTRNILIVPTSFWQKQLQFLCLLFLLHKVGVDELNNCKLGHHVSSQLNYYWNHIVVLFLFSSSSLSLLAQLSQSSAFVH